MRNFVLITKRKQDGFSLIELLIAMFIGLFLLAGITSSYLYSKKTSIERDQYSLLEDNGRIAIELMSRTLEHTGYTSSIGAPLVNKFITGAVTSRVCPGGGNSVLNTGIFQTTSNDDTDGDRIGIVYLGDGDISSDCTGATLPANCQVSPLTTTETASIYNFFFLNKANDTLMCAGSRDSTAQVMAEGIENLQILYGIDANEDKAVDRYVNAADVNGWWSNIISIQIAVLVRANRETKDQPESITYTLLDTPITSPTDRYKRAVFSTTVNLRNTL